MPSFTSTVPTGTIQGHVSAGFETVADTFLRNFAEHGEVGASLQVKVQGETVVDVTAALSVLPAVRWPLPRYDPLVAHLDTLHPGIASAALRGAVLPLAGRTLHSPIASPGKIVAVRRNYSGAKENDNFGSSR